MANEIEIVVKSKDRTDRGFADAEKRAERFKGAIKGIAGAASAAGVAAGGLLAKGLSDNLNIDAGVDRLQGQLGLTGRAASVAGQAAGQVYRDAWGTSLDDVNAAIKAVGTNLVDLNTAGQDEIAGLAAKAQFLADTFQVDVADSTRAAGQLMRTGLADNAEQAFDIITKGMQGGADRAGDFLDTLNEYSPQFRKLGIDGPQALSLLSAGMDAGAFNADKVGDAIKEFSIRAIDGSKTTADGFKLAGLNADQLAARIAKGGPTAQRAFQQTLQAILSIRDPVKRDAAGVALFGAQWEDLGPKVMGAMAKATPAVKGLAGATDEAMAQVGDNAQARVEGMKRGFEAWTQSMASAEGPLGAMSAGVMAFGGDALAAAGSAGQLAAGMAVMNREAVVGAAKQAAAAAGVVASKVAMLAAAAASKVWTAAQWLLNAAMTANPIGIVIAIIVALVAAIVIAYKRSETFRNIVQGVFRAVVTAGRNFWTGIKHVFNQFMTLARKVADRVRSDLGRIITFLRELPGRALQYGRDLISNFIAGVRAMAGALRSAILGIIPGPIADFLHLRSPAKEGPLSEGGGPEGWGRKLVDQYAQGIGRGSVRGAASGLASDIAGGRGGGMVTLRISSGGSRLDDLLVELLRKSIRAHGGNVQEALGT